MIWYGHRTWLLFQKRTHDDFKDFQGLDFLFSNSRTIKFYGNPANETTQGLFEAWSTTGLDVILLPTLFSTILNNTVEPESDVTMLNNMFNNVGSKTLFTLFESTYAAASCSLLAMDFLR